MTQMDNRGQFTFYRSFWEAVKGLPKKDRLPILEAIIEYALDGTNRIPLSAKQARIFTEVLPGLDAERRFAAEGRRTAEYKQWRKAVFERDNYTCLNCKRKGVRINAHHIKQYAYYPELRYEIGNGVTLCVPCHKLIHRIMRKGLQ